MPTYGAFDDFVTGLSAASALDGTEVFPAVQSSATVKASPDQIATYIHANPEGITNTVRITGEYLFTEDNELDYSASFTDAMSAQTVTFSELPADTVAIYVYINLADTGSSPDLKWKRTSGGTLGLETEFSFADGGTNVVQGFFWWPTGGNSIYVTSMEADAASTIYIMGYKTGS